MPIRMHRPAIKRVVQCVVDMASAVVRIVSCGAELGDDVVRLRTTPGRNGVAAWERDQPFVHADRLLGSARPEGLLATHAHEASSDDT